MRCSQTIRELVADGMTILIVTHEMGFARRRRRVVFMDAGKVVEEAPPEIIFTNPRADRTRDLSCQSAEQGEANMMSTREFCLRRLALCCSLAVAMLAFAAGLGSPRTLQDVVSRGEMKIGYIPAPPGTIKDANTGELSGFYVDGIREIAAMMKVKPVFVETTWGTFVAGLQSGQFDMAIAGTFATVQRAMVVSFTKPIFYLGYGAVVRVNDTRYKTLDDMNTPETRIAVMQGGSAEDFARRNMPKAQIITLATGNLTAGFVEVVAGRADVSLERLYHQCVRGEATDGEKSVRR